MVPKQLQLHEGAAQTKTKFSMQGNLNERMQGNLMIQEFHLSDTSLFSYLCRHRRHFHLQKLHSVAGHTSHGVV